MNTSILALALAILTQAITAVWWAARLSAQFEHLSHLVTKARIDLSEVQALVHTHEIELAVLNRPMSR